MVCALNGVAGPDLTAPFTYCELGCGIGETTALLAASYPQARFVGIDLSPTHIEKAVALAKAGALENVEFIAADVATIDLDTLPGFDFVTLHGLYAWVPPQVQRAIREFLSRKLRPGGVTYVSYNAMPGWAAVGPLRRYFTTRARALEGDLLGRVQQIVAELMTLREQGAPFFRDNPATAAILEHLQSADPRYLVHEYLGADWDPAYFTDVHDDMQASGLQFVALASIIDNLVEHSIAPSFTERLRQQPDTRAREDLRDFIQNRFFRRDIYRQPEHQDTARTDDAGFDATPIGLIADPVQIPDTITITDAPSITLKGEWFERIKQRLGYRVLTFDELCDDPMLGNADRDQLREIVKLMAAGGFCVPCVTRETEPPRGPIERIRVVPRLNEVLLEQHDWGDLPLVLASPVLGNGLVLNALETILLASLHFDRPLSSVWSQLREKDIELRSEKTAGTIDDDTEAIQALEDAMQQFQRYKLPKLAYLGIVAATG